MCTKKGTVLVLHSASLVAIILALGICTAPAAYAARVPSLSGQPGIKDASSCKHLYVHLNGNKPATQKCLDNLKTSPNFESGNCTTTDWIHLFQNTYETGADLCVDGKGCGNLTDYWISWPFTNWNDQLSSFSAHNVTFWMFQNTDCFNTLGNPYLYYTIPGYITISTMPSGWNDVVSSIYIQ